MTTGWMTARQATAVLGVSMRTLERWAEAGRVQTRLAQSGRGRWFVAEQVEALARERAARPGPMDDVRARARQRALWALKQRYPDEYAALYARELAGEGLCLS